MVYFPSKSAASPFNVPPISIYTEAFHIGSPVLVADLPEMKNLVNQYELGEIIEKHDAKHIAEKINSMLTNEPQMKVWSENAKKAAQELNWEKEKHVIASLF